MEKRKYEHEKEIEYFDEEFFINSTSEFITYPIKSAFFYLKGKQVKSQIAFLKFYPKEGILTASGKDQYGEFSTFGKFDSNFNIKATKVYDNHKLLIDLSLKGNTMQGYWRNPNDSNFNTNNKVEVVINLQEFNLLITDKQGKLIKNKIFSNFLIDDNLDDYVGLLYKGKNVEFLDCSVYDVTHVVYCSLLFDGRKTYLSGNFKVDTMSFEFEETELVK